MQGSAVKAVAEQHGLPLLQPPKICAETVAAVAGWEPDVLVVSAYGLILPPALLETPRLGCVNIHASLLPRWRGAAPIERAIEAGDPQTGITIMAMDQGCDTGGIFQMVPYVIAPEDTMGSVTDALAAVGAEVLMETLPLIASGEMVATPQDSTHANYAKKVLKSCAELHWVGGAVELERAVRAFNPRPVAHSWMHAAATEGQGVGSTYVRVWAAEASGVALGSGKLVGEVASASEDGVWVRTGCGGLLRLLELQPANSPRLSAAEFYRQFEATLAAGVRFGGEQPAARLAERKTRQEYLN